MQRIVYLPGNRTVTLGNYVKAWRMVLTAAPGTVFDKAFNWWPETREDILREFREGLHDRINRRVDGFPGVLRPVNIHQRKLDHQWQVETERAARQLNRPRLVIDWLPAWLKPRFAHRLRESMAL